MENIEGKPSNPFIGLLVKNIDYVIECMAQNNYGQALQGMVLTFNNLKSEHKNSERGKAFKQKLMKAWIGRVTPHDLAFPKNVLMVDPFYRYQDIKLREKQGMLGYYELQDELQSMLHKWKYYEESTYIGIVSAQTLAKTEETPPETPSPERLPEALE